MAMTTASYLNRTFAEQQTFCKQVSIKHKTSSDMGRFRNSRKIRLLYVVIGGRTERIEVKEDFWFSVSEGSTIIGIFSGTRKDGK